MTEEDNSIRAGETDTLEGTRDDCCKEIDIALGVYDEDGTQLAILVKTLKAPSGQCMVEESFEVEQEIRVSGSASFRLR